jgi:hypothetical protein
MEFPAENPAELADDLSRCEKVTLKFDNENHTLTPEEVHWLVAALTNGPVSQNVASIDAGKRDTPPRRVSEIETVGWAILQALHEGVDDGPQSWSDMASDQEKRIKKAAIAAIEAVTDLSQYKAQGFTPWFQPEVDFASPEESEKYDRSALARNYQPPVAWRCRWKSEPDWKYDEKPCSARDHAREEPGFEEQALCLETSLAELRWALEIQEKAEEAHANCTECDGEEVPELCPKCFPLYDDARLARRRCLALPQAAP